MKRDVVGIVGFCLFCGGAAMAWLPAGLMLAGALLLTFSIIGIVRGD